jgi:hypothetical protein
MKATLDGVRCGSIQVMVLVGLPVLVLVYVFSFARRRIVGRGIMKLSDGLAFGIDSVS